jgi:hypothetical protein
MPLLDDQPMTRNPLGEIRVGAVPLCVSVTVRPPMVSLIVRAVACRIDVTCRPGVEDVTLADPADLARYGLTGEGDGDYPARARINDALARLSSGSSCP